MNKRQKILLVAMMALMPVAALIADPAPAKDASPALAKGAVLTPAKGGGPAPAKGPSPAPAGPSAEVSRLPVNEIQMPSGFKIDVFCDKVPGARSMVLSPNGTLYVGTKDRGCVYAVSDANKDFKADRVRTIATGLHMPNGVELRNGSLYIAEVNRITRLDNIDQNLDHPPRPVLIYDKLSDIEHHGWKYIRFGPDGWLYVPVGAPCNVCLREDPFAGISRMKPDGTEFQSFARGIRNTVGYDWDPDTKELWFTDNGRDWLGDDIPPDELNHAPRAGMHFGFPFRYGQNVVDNSDFSITMRTPKDVTFTPAARDLSPHIAALGMRFYTGKMFPKQYFHQIFIAEHGSWNRKSPLGARVMLVKLKDGHCISYEPFATGWQRKDGSRWGRPVDVINMPDGSMLVSDDEAGAIYRISYQADVKQ